MLLLFDGRATFPNCFVFLPALCPAIYWCWWSISKYLYYSTTIGPLHGLSHLIWTTPKRKRYKNLRGAELTTCISSPSNRGKLMFWRSQLCEGGNISAAPFLSTKRTTTIFNCFLSNNTLTSLERKCFLGL